MGTRAGPRTAAGTKIGESAVERGADVVAAGAGELFAEMGARWKRLAKAIEEDTPEQDADEASLQHDDRTLEAGRAIFAREGHGAVVGAGVEALAALDEDETPNDDPSKTTRTTAARRNQAKRTSPSARSRSSGSSARSSSSPAP